MWNISIWEKNVDSKNASNLFLKDKPEDHWSCIAHLIAGNVLKSAVIEEKKFKNIECKWFGPRSMTDLDLWYS